MACSAAVRCAYAATETPGLTSREIWEKVRWWTPETIDEALQDLVQAGILRNQSGLILRVEDSEAAR